MGEMMGPPHVSSPGDRTARVPSNDSGLNAGQYKAPSPALGICGLAVHWASSVNDPSLGSWIYIPYIRGHL